MLKENCNKLLHDKITQNYKKYSNIIKRNIDKEVGNIAKFSRIEDIIECYVERSGLLTLEDQKGNFRSNTKCRLLKPSKSGIGVISKTFLDWIIKELKRFLKVNQYRETSTLISWFKKVDNKNIKIYIINILYSLLLSLYNREITWQLYYFC